MDGFRKLSEVFRFAAKIGENAKPIADGVRKNAGIIWINQAQREEPTRFSVPSNIELDAELTRRPSSFCVVLRRGHGQELAANKIAPDDMRSFP